MHERPLRLRGECIEKSEGRHALLVVDVRGQDPVVALGEQFRQPAAKGWIVRIRGSEVGDSCPEPVRSSHRDDRRRQSLGDRPQDAFVIRSGTVDLVHEDQSGNLQPLQRPHQQRRLRLHAFDGGDHEHSAVEHAQHAFYLRDEVRVAGRIDQVDGDVVDRKRRNGGADRDTALLLQRQGIGLSGAGIDAADLIDDVSGVEQPLRESCLTGVYMRQDPQVQRFLRQASYPPNRLKVPFRLT